MRAQVESKKPYPTDQAGRRVQMGSLPGSRVILGPTTITYPSSPAPASTAQPSVSRKILTGLEQSRAKRKK